MALSKRQAAKAARLYGLAVLCHSDCAGANDDDEARVMDLAREQAVIKLAAMGYEPMDLISIADCIAAVSRLG